MLCEIEDVKVALGGVSGTGKDALITSCVAGADAWARSYTGRDFESTTYTEYYSPGYSDPRVIRGGAALMPKHWPIISVTSLYEDSHRTFSDVADLIAASDYWTDDYTLNLYTDGSQAAFVPGERTVRLIYVAGYSTLPADVVRAAVILAVHLFHLADKMKQGIASETMGGVTVTYRDEDMPKEAKAILDRYRAPSGL